MVQLNIEQRNAISILESIIRSLKVDDIIENFTYNMKKLIGCEKVVFYLYDDTTGELVEKSKDSTEYSNKFRPQSGIILQCIQTQSII